MAQCADAAGGARVVGGVAVCGLLFVVLLLCVVVFGWFSLFAASRERDVVDIQSEECGAAGELDEWWRWW